MHSLLTSELNSLRRRCYPPYPFNKRLTGPQRLNAMAKRTNSFLCTESNDDYLDVKPMASSLYCRQNDAALFTEHLHHTWHARSVRCKFEAKMCPYWRQEGGDLTQADRDSMMLQCRPMHRNFVTASKQYYFNEYSRHECGKFLRGNLKNLLAKYDSALPKEAQVLLHCFVVVI
jgi:hypothetical protein